MRGIGVRPDLISTRATEKHLDLAYVVEGDLPAAISGDLTRLRQILLNLLSNAVKFTENGEVVLTVSSKPLPDDKHELTFTVRDTGIGLTPEGMSRLSQSFSQADSSTTRKYGGTGLGLVISKRLAELMGGTMAAESAGPGKGSTFRFTIQAGKAQLPPARERNLLGVQAELKGKRLLIVDEIDYPLHDRDALVTACGRICMMRKKINISTFMAGQRLGLKEVDDGIWVVTFMAYDLGYIDLYVLLPMCPGRTDFIWSERGDLNSRPPVPQID